MIIKSMSDDTAIDIAIKSIEAVIATLQIDADLCDIWSNTTELGLPCSFRTPRRIAASEKRKKLRLAIDVLERMRPRQHMFDQELAV